MVPTGEHESWIGHGELDWTYQQYTSEWVLIEFDVCQPGLVSSTHWCSQEPERVCDRPDEVNAPGSMCRNEGKG